MLGGPVRSLETIGGEWSLQYSLMRQISSMLSMTRGLKRLNCAGHVSDDYICPAAPWLSPPSLLPAAQLAPVGMGQRDGVFQNKV